MSEPEVVTIDDELPQLEIPAPCCSHCRNDVTMDDGAAWCETCLVSWDRIEDGWRAVPDNDANVEDVYEPCAAASPSHRATEDKGPSIVTREYRPCILPSGHAGEHLHPLTRTTTMKPPCGVVGGASTTRGGAPVPDMPCIREENHPGDHANGSRYWPRPRRRCTEQYANDGYWFRCDDTTGSPHTEHRQAGAGPAGSTAVWHTDVPAL